MAFVGIAAGTAADMAADMAAGIAVGMAVGTSDFEAVLVGTFGLEVVLAVGAVVHTDLDTSMSLSYLHTPLLVDHDGDGGSFWRNW